MSNATGATETPAVKANGTNAPSTNVKSWGAVEGIDAADLLVPKIFHQQGLSKFVGEGKAKIGDFCDSLTGEVLAKKEGKLEVIIFGSFKNVVISKQVPGSNPPQFKLHDVIQITKENAPQWAMAGLGETTTEGTFKYNLQYNYYCLIPGRTKDLPYVISLGSTKTKVAKQLNTMIMKLSQKNLPSASCVFEFTSTTEKNDKGQWAGLQVTQGRATKEVEIETAHAWYMKSKSERFVVVEEETAAEAQDLPF